MILSDFGERATRHTGVVDLMEDLGTALSSPQEMILMGGGNPARIAHMEEIFRERLIHILNDEQTLHRMIGVYQSPQGDIEFREQIARLLRREYGWDLDVNNIAVSNGSQAAFFVLFNMLAGRCGDSTRHIVLPLAPEYVGYSNLGLEDGLYRAYTPSIDMLSEHEFKYRVDFDSLVLDQSSAAICVSRPTNPTGNVLTDDEIGRLDRIAHERGIPLIIDGAYGTPFPRIIFTEAEPHWNDNTILVLSLSKLGLPGARTGIIVANEAIIKAYGNANTVLNLACGNLGPAIATELLRDGEILRLSREHIGPFYHRKALETVAWMREDLGDLPWRVHKPEGAIFLWLWLEGLPISSQELYQRLKSRGVMVVPGEEFFIGLDPQWPHSRECIRVTYSQEPLRVRQGVTIIADEVRRAYERRA